jgi:purine catabolism regulator
LVERRWQSEADMARRALQAGLNLHAPQQMIVLDMDGQAVTQGGILAEFRRMLMRVAPAEAAAATVVAHERRIICLLGAGSEFRTGQVRRLADVLAMELGRSAAQPFVVVIGEVCARPEDYPAIWARCNRLIGIGKSFGLTGVLMATGSAPLELLVSALDAGEVRDYLRDSIGALLQHDREHQTDYFDTLACYLREGCRPQPCADAMQLHVSTLRYRLTRMGDGVRLDAVVSSLPSILDAQKAGYPIKQLGEPVFYEPLAVAIEHGDAELEAKVAEAVAAMQADGTLSKLSEKWYGVDYSKAE